MQGETIRFDLDDAVIVAERVVRIVRRETTASGDTAVYEDKAERLKITGKVRLSWKTEEVKRVDEGEMFGREIIITGKDTTLSEITARGEPRIRWTRVNRDNQRYLSLLKADSLQIVFREGSKPQFLLAQGHATSLHIADRGEEPDRLRGGMISVDLGMAEQTIITAEGDAEGIYMDEKRGGKRGNGRVRGERIRLVMEDQKISRVEVDGGVAGVYKEQGTRGQGDKGTEGQRDRGTEGQGDKGTGGQGE